MPNPNLTHLLDADGVRFCAAENGPAVPECALLGGTCADGVMYCATCTRAALIPIVTLAQSRSGGDPLLDTIIFLTQTPPEVEGAVMRILARALLDLDDYVEQIGGRHD